MKFPGARLLHNWDLAVHKLSMNDLLRSCQQVGLTGFLELQFPDAVAMILYYLGSEVSAMYRVGPSGLTGEAALERLRTHVEAAPSGTVGVYELPLDMAHLLRGMTNRHRLEEPVRGRHDLARLLEGFEQEQRTGTLELHVPSRGAGMLLLVAGRVSNVYWESESGATLEKEAARRYLDGQLDRHAATAFLSTFSRESWVGRQEVQGSLPRRTVPEGPRSTAQMATEEAGLRTDVLEDLWLQLPALLHLAILDLATGSVLAEKQRGADTLRSGLLPSRLPSMLLEMQRRLAEDNDDLEQLVLSTARVTALAAVVRRANEAILLVADKAQPAALLASTLQRSADIYAVRVQQLVSPEGPGRPI